MTDSANGSGRSSHVTSVYTAFRERVSRGEAVDIEQLCSEHPEIAAELRRQHADWARLEAGLDAERQEQPTVSTAAADEGSSWQRLLDQLRSRGQVWRRYSIGEELARGGMGVIHRIYDPDTRRSLAMKIMRGERTTPSSSAEDASLGRFLEEAQVTAQLDHPGVVPVHEVGVDDEGRVYFTMKLVRGEDLRAVFAKVRAGQEGWSLTRVLGLLQRVCEAMSYAHAKGVIHRDLKPANVMAGRFGEVYVMDWGLARILDSDDPRESRRHPDPPRSRSAVGSDRRDSGRAAGQSPLLTMDGDVVGTPSYMPPEQAEGRLEKIGPHSDVYAVGAMLYELLTGVAPFSQEATSASPHAVLARILAGPPEPVSRLRPGSPPELVAICERAMAHEIADRYPTMAGLAGDLRAFLEQRVVRAYATGPLMELRKWIGRNRALAAAVAAAVLLAITSGFLLAWQQGRLAQERQERFLAIAKERDVARAVVAFQKEMLTIDAWEDGAEVKALDLVDRAAAGLSEAYAGVPETDAAVRAAVGKTYSSLGVYDRAERQAAIALGICRREFGPDDPRTLDAIDELKLLPFADCGTTRPEGALVAEPRADVLALLDGLEDDLLVRGFDQLELLPAADLAAGRAEEALGAEAGADVLAVLRALQRDLFGQTGALGEASPGQTGGHHDDRMNGTYLPAPVRVCRRALPGDS